MHLYEWKVDGWNGDGLHMQKCASCNRRERERVSVIIPMEFYTYFQTQQIDPPTL